MPSQSDISEAASTSGSESRWAASGVGPVGGLRPDASSGAARRSVLQAGVHYGPPGRAAANGSSVRADGGQSGKLDAASARGWLDITAKLLPALGATGAWMASSSLLIFLNKALYSDGFVFPLTTTAMGQVFSVAGGLLMARMGMMTLRPVPSVRHALTTLLPVAGAFAGTLYTGNAAYLSLSVAFIQILKAFTPGLTLLLACLAGLEQATFPLVASVLCIGGGVGVAVLLETASSTFSAVGFALFMLSSLFEALRVVLVQKLQGRQRYNTAESLVYVGLPTAAMLFALAAVYERDGLQERGIALLVAQPLLYFAAFFSSLLTNLCCYHAIQLTSSLTFKVVGCLKNLVVIWGGTLQGDTVSVAQLAGFLVSSLGFVGYCYTKLPAQAANRFREAKAA